MGLDFIWQEDWMVYYQEIRQRQIIGGFEFRASQD